MISRSESNKKWREKNPHKIQEYNNRRKEAKKLWYEQNKQKQFKEQEKNFEKYLYSSCKRNAQVKNVPFNLQQCDIIIPEFCAYLKIPLTKIRGNGKVSTNASVDRIIPAKGYVKNNIQIISLRANRMKQDASKQELITFAKSTLEMYDTSTN